MKWYIHVIKNYAVFKGRARCKEYWGFHFIYALLLLLIITLPIIIIRIISSGDEYLYRHMLSNIYPYVSGIIAINFIITFIPALAVSVRRLHDTGRSGFWIFIGLIPILYLIVFYFLMIKGDIGQNKYGKDPKDDEFSNDITIFELQKKQIDEYTDGFSLVVIKETSLFKKPSTDSGIFLSLKKGDQVNAVDSIIKQKVTWTRVETANEHEVGWVLSDFLKENDE